MNGTVFDWFHVLTPITIGICAINLLVGFALKPEHRTTTLRSLSNLGYGGCLIGWLIMWLGVSLHPMSLIMKVATIGWFILMPSLLLVTGCCIKKVWKDKSCYANWAIQMTRITSTVLHYIVLIICKSFIAIFFFICYLLATTKRSTYEEMEEERKRKKPYPFISHRANDPNADGYSDE